MINIERLDAVLAHIKTLPDAVELNLDNNYAVPMWDQTKWIAIPQILTDSMGNPMKEGSCGTAGCFAGWAVMLFVEDFELDLVDLHEGRDMVDNIIVGGEKISIELMARQLLGLNAFEADALFEYGNDLAAIEIVLDKIKRGVYDPEFGDAEADDDL